MCGGIQSTTCLRESLSRRTWEQAGQHVAPILVIQGHKKTLELIYRNLILHCSQPEKNSLGFTLI